MGSVSSNFSNDQQKENSRIQQKKEESLESRLIRRSNLERELKEMLTFLMENVGKVSTHEIFLRKKKILSFCHKMNCRFLTRSSTNTCFQRKRRKK